MRDAVKLAYIALESGDVAGGTHILTATLPVVRTLPRLGVFGQGIRDVQILAMLGRREDALLALRAAVEAGFRGSIPYDNWLLEFDPFFDSIRDDNRFAAIVSELEILNGVIRTPGPAGRGIGRLGCVKSDRRFRKIRRPRPIIINNIQYH